MRILRVLAIALLAAFAGVAASTAKTSHEGWPARTGVLRIAPDLDTAFRGTQRNDELLGGHGSDLLAGRKGRDVLWGDKSPSGQPETQHDTLLGNAGDDFIYASHGANTIAAGPGADIVHAHFGRGAIDCGGGKDVLFISRRSMPGYTIRNCEAISFKTLGY
jgi:Ca2+-binding RTX toxin-like protein